MSTDPKSTAAGVGAESEVQSFLSAMRGCKHVNNLSVES